MIYIGGGGGYEKSNGLSVKKVFSSSAGIVGRGYLV